MEMNSIGSIFNIGDMGNNDVGEEILFPSQNREDSISRSGVVNKCPISSHINKGRRVINILLPLFAIRVSIILINIRCSELLDEQFTFKIIEKISNNMECKIVY